jgi:hypothetical protein
MSNNPYLRVGTDSDQEEEDDEFGLDDPIELTAAGTKKKKRGRRRMVGNTVIKIFFYTCILYMISSTTHPRSTFH